TPLESTSASFNVYELEESGDKARVAIQSSEGMVMGWVATNRLKPLSGPQEIRQSMCFGCSGTEPESPPAVHLETGWVCPDRVPFAAMPERSTELVWFGEILAGTLIGNVMPPTSGAEHVPDGWVPIQLRGIASNRLAVQATDLEKCKERPSRP